MEDFQFGDALAQQPGQLGLLFPKIGRDRFRDAPAEVHLDELHLALSAQPAQGGPGVRHQFVALLHHVPKGRGDEDADGAVAGETDWLRHVAPLVFTILTVQVQNRLSWTCGLITNGTPTV